MEPGNIFKIGHSESQSETYVPNVWYDKKSGITFADVAGFNDTGGDFIEIINNFVVKYIFLKAKSVRFLIPLTVESIYQSRGQVLSKQLATICRMTNVSYTEMSKAIMPIITKIEPNEEDS